jgi:hypothetical protein
MTLNSFFVARCTSTRLPLGALGNVVGHRDLHCSSGPRPPEGEAHAERRRHFSDEPTSRHARHHAFPFKTV